MTATEAVWRELSADLRGFLRRRVQDDATAEDLLMETFARIHDRIETLRDDERVAPWAYRIARNLLIDHYRRTRPHDELPDDLTAPTAEDDTDTRRVARWLPALVDQLDEPYRDAVRLSELEELTQREVAERLGLSLSGAKSRVQRGRHKLRETLLACCHVELDREGQVVEVERCARCDC